MQGTPQTPHNLSDELISLFENPQNDDLSLGNLVDAAAERGFGLIFILFALPAGIPILPPGSAAFVGLLFICFSIQMLLGFRRPWLPDRLRNKRVPRAVTRFLAERATPLIARLTRMSRPRFAFARQELFRRIAAIGALLMGIIMVLPIPLMNAPPSLAVLLIGIGLLNADGALAILGLAFAGSLVSLLLAAALIGGSWISALLARLPWH